MGRGGLGLFAAGFESKGEFWFGGMVLKREFWSVGVGEEWFRVLRELEVEIMGRELGFPVAKGTVRVDSISAREPN